MALRSDRVVLVTGASRGAGRGIAHGLAAGATVYVTGRSTADGADADGFGGTVAATAAEVDERGGTGIPVVCDHGDDEQVAELFARIERDHGRLDVLVNNAIALPPELPGARPFWEMPLATEVRLLDVGLRSHYVAAYHAARMMVRQREGLIVHISSSGARTHMPGVHTPPYGAGKAGSDKMVFDMAQELRPHGVTALSIWPGLLLTERVQAHLAAGLDLDGGTFPPAETPEFVGRIIDALASDERLAERTGGCFYSSELGAEYGVTDVDGTAPVSRRGWLGAPSAFARTHATYAEYLASQAPGAS
jgi:NAD(P)-dependent dehydrogenase (short-subunit alcohol dehydrogenase family)